MERYSSAVGARRLRWVAGAVAAFAVIVVAAIAAAETGAPPAAKAPPLTAPSTGGNYLPSLALVDQNGKPVLLSSFKGKPVLVGFIHTSCKGVCEMLTAKMKQVAQSLGAGFGSSVTMISITTDPDEDNSAQLLKYAVAQGANTSGYVFLTGKSAQIDRLLELYDVPDEGPDEATTHVLDLFLVAPDGSTMRKYNGMSVSSQALASAIRSSAAGR